ncbi:hypothetical protein [Microbacterium rhizomatis]|uniref:Uncharacterized protein n=1 Tax=Microbacterium rhizomatis TaxID=1631477 RepID=A0A5J5IZ45_9MICO|nr:hypothetical protein [Microbacterium rhizomatis]KAA9107596.1 hypothetical protein F6B43_09020 [Microbacterium rhizomatis]
MTGGESRELDELRRRVFGPDPAQTVTDADIRRLRELEGIQSETVTLPAPVDAPLDGPLDERPPMGEPGEPGDPAIVGAKRFAPSGWPRWLLPSVSAIALAAIGLCVGVGIGVGIAGGRVLNPEAGSTLPELATAQTDEDRLPAQFLGSDPHIDPDTVRFVAILDGYYIALARPSAYDGICIVSFRTDRQNRTADSVGCAGEGASGSVSGSGLAVAISGTLNVVVGEMTVEGEPIRLSESVTAYRH